jgi:DNA topoisomerase-1
MTVEHALALLEAAARGPQALGEDPETGDPVFVRTGRFGPYVQRGEPVEGSKQKPKMVSLLPGMEPETIDLATALRLLSLPRDLGAHPDDAKGEHVFAHLGRYGPYVKWGNESRSIPADVSVLDVDLARAVALLAQPRRGRGQSAPAEPIKELGPHPETGAPLKVLPGRYGPYVTDGTLNASLPRSADPANVTIEDALELLRRRAERVAAGGGRGRGKTAKKKAAPKKAPAKKKAARKKSAQKKAAPKKAPKK